MTAPCDNFHYHVINVDLLVFPYMVGEHLVHYPLVGGSSILEVKEHEIIVVVAMIQHKGCFGNVQGVHQNRFLYLEYASLKLKIRYYGEVLIW